jgi:hypothetical protein
MVNNQFQLMQNREHEGSAENRAVIDDMTSEVIDRPSLILDSRDQPSDPAFEGEWT